VTLIVPPTTTAAIHRVLSVVKLLMIASSSSSAIRERAPRTYVFGMKLFLRSPSFLLSIFRIRSSARHFVWLCHGLCPSLHRSFYSQIANISTDSRANQLVLVNQLTLAWTTNAMIQYLMDERTGPPVEAAKNGLYTTFQETFSEDQNALKPGQKISDQKLWHDVCLSYSISGSMC
jgi:hypothetical protein